MDSSALIGVRFTREEDALLLEKIDRQSLSFETASNQMAGRNVTGLRRRYRLLKKESAAKRDISSKKLRAIKRADKPSLETRLRAEEKPKPGSILQKQVQHRTSPITHFLRSSLGNVPHDTGTGRAFPTNTQDPVSDDDHDDIDEEEEEEDDDDDDDEMGVDNKENVGRTQPSEHGHIHDGTASLFPSPGKHTQQWTPQVNMKDLMKDFIPDKASLSISERLIAAFDTRDILLTCYEHPFTTAEDELLLSLAVEIWPWSHTQAMMPDRAISNIKARAWWLHATDGTTLDRTPLDPLFPFPRTLRGLSAFEERNHDRTSARALYTLSLMLPSAPSGASRICSEYARAWPFGPSACNAVLAHARAAFKQGILLPAPPSLSPPAHPEDERVPGLRVFADAERRAASGRGQAQYTLALLLERLQLEGRVEHKEIARRYAEAWDEDADLEGGKQGRSRRMRLHALELAWDEATYRGGRLGSWTEALLKTRAKAASLLKAKTKAASLVRANQEKVKKRG